MSLVLGLDTGGTFTDAALLDKQSRTVLATAKALTTRQICQLELARRLKLCWRNGAVMQPQFRGNPVNHARHQFRC